MAKAEFTIARLNVDDLPTDVSEFIAVVQGYKNDNNTGSMSIEFRFYGNSQQGVGVDKTMILTQTRTETTDERVLREGRETSEEVELRVTEQAELARLKAKYE